jgi:hypothetical protein
VVSNCRSVYGLRKVFICKEILIFSSKNLTFYVVKWKTFLISWIHFTYKCVILDTKTKQNIFLKFLKYWPNSCDFNKLVIKAKIHAKTYFFEVFFSVWQYDMVFSLRDLAVCLKTKTNFFNFLMFWQKSGILILDLYLYSIKIQTNIKQNLVKKTWKNYNFWNFFFWI